MSTFLEKLYASSPIPVQNVMLSLYGIKIYRERYGKKFRKCLDEFLKTQWYTEDELIRYQNERLQLLIRHSYETVPYYNRIMEEHHLTPRDIQTVQDLHKMPILRREHLKSNPDEFVSTSYKKRQLIEGHTSGTTGSPLKLYYDISCCVATNAVDWRQKLWAGFDYGEKYALLLGRIVVPTTQKKPPFWRTNYVQRQLWLSSYHLKPGNLPYYLDKLQKFKPAALEAYPSTAYILARYLMNQRATFPLKAVLTSSETLLPFQRETIEKSFQCKIFDYFGMAERVAFATECENHTGHHLNIDYGITEIVDKNGEPIENGRMGRIVGTSIHNLAMPLIRYETNDVTSVQKKKCACGREFPLIDDVATRTEDIVVTKDGRMISPTVLMYPIDPLFDKVEMSQIIQDDISNITVKIVKLPQYSQQDTNLLLSGLHERVGDDMEIKIEFVDSIPTGPSGKFRFVVSKVELPI